MENEEVSFQILECQNQACSLRFPTNLSVKQLAACPLCGGALLPSGAPFSNQKAPPSRRMEPGRRVDLLLDNLRSTLNVGSIFRTADGAGVSHVYCCGTTPTPEHPKIVKTGLGAEFSVSWSAHRNALEVLPALARGTLVCALEASASSHDLFMEVRHIEPASSVLLILGNEVSGVDPQLMQRSDLVLSLPMLGKKSSLNVAVAAGIAIYALRFYS